MEISQGYLNPFNDEKIHDLTDNFKSKVSEIAKGEYEWLQYIIMTDQCVENKYTRSFCGNPFTMTRPSLMSLLKKVHYLFREI